MKSDLVHEGPTHNFFFFLNYIEKKKKRYLEEAMSKVRCMKIERHSGFKFIYIN
jgi:hypothetical protein